MIRFDSKNHRYFSEAGVELPSVTTILKAAGLIDASWYTAESAELGKALAEATQLDDENDLDDSTVDPRIVNKVRAWREFKAAQSPDFRIMAAEAIVSSDVYGFAGTIDRRVSYGPTNQAIIDIKGGQPEPWHSLQLAGYAICFPTFHRRINVYLRDDGTFRVVEHSDPADADVFLSALAIMNWKGK